jgi:hypothetical protein
MKDHARLHLVLAVLALVAALLALVAPASAFADDPSGEPEPVPSIDPDWSANFVPPPQPRIRAATRCLPLDAVFYAATDWLRLAQKLRANPSACANYYVSIPPFSADKSTLRPNEAGQIRALGPQFHAMAEINVTGWASWVAADSTRTWFDAGVEARRRMAAAGFDVDAGDIWAVNEFSSAVRTNTGPARQNMRDLVRGLYTGDGTTPLQGLIWVSGIGQQTTNLGPYKTNVKLWLGDAAFWSDMGQYVRFFSQEVYANPLKWAVAGATPQDRLGPLADYLEHFGVLAGHGPADVSAGSAYMAQANAPTANAAWPRPGFDWGPVTNPAPIPVAQDFISAQVYAFRHQEASRDGQAWGFAWSPINFTQANDHVPPISDFLNKTASLLDRLAASIHASDVPADDAGIAACGPDLAWCDDSVDGSSLNTAWHIFNTWSQPVASDSSALVQEGSAAELTLNATDADGDPLTYTVVSQPLNGTLTGSGPKVTYTPAQGFSGADSFSFRVSDGVMDSRTATVSITVNAPPTVIVDPAGPVDEGSPITLTAHASDAEGAPLTFRWSADKGTIVPNGDTATLTVDDGPDFAHVTVTADDGNGGTATSMADVEVRNVPPTADAGADMTVVWGVPLRLSGSASDPSHADAERGLLAQWLFGDGSTGEGLDVSHVYANPGAYTATLRVRDKDGGVGSDSATVAVGARPVRLASTTAAIVDAGSAVVSARLVDGSDASSSRLDGHSVALTIGSSTCFATSDAAGAAHCRLDGSSLPLGPATATARFDGDALYQAASTSSPVLLYRLPAGGVFAVGDKSASGQVTFWSPSWWLANTLSGGAAPASFKGFVQPSGSGWTASPGLAAAPATVPAWMGVLTTKSVTKDGAVITGDGMHMIVVHVDNYDPTIVGLGTVVASAN